MRRSAESVENSCKHCDESLCVWNQYKDIMAKHYQALEKNIADKKNAKETKGVHDVERKK